jgi:hypothetical protein
LFVTGWSPDAIARELHTDPAAVEAAVRRAVGFSNSR